MLSFEKKKPNNKKSLKRMRKEQPNTLGDRSVVNVIQKERKGEGSALRKRTGRRIVPWQPRLMLEEITRGLNGCCQGRIFVRSCWRKGRLTGLVRAISTG